MVSEMLACPHELDRRVRSDGQTEMRCSKLEAFLRFGCTFPLRQCALCHAARGDSERPEDNEFFLGWAQKLRRVYLHAGDLPRYRGRTVAVKDVFGNFARHATREERQELLREMWDHQVRFCGTTDGHDAGTLAAKFDDLERTFGLEGTIGAARPD